jgi:hypothetical protein
MKRVLSILLVAVCARTAAAQDTINEPRWSVRTTFGSARIHKWDERADWFEVRVGRRIRSGLASVDVGIGGSGAPSPFTSLTTGLEIQPWRQRQVSPFLRGEIGFLGESDFAGIVGGIGGGVIVRLSRRFGLRAGGALNSHGVTKGPVTSYGGIEYRW